VVSGLVAENRKLYRMLDQGPRFGQRRGVGLVALLVVMVVVTLPIARAQLTSDDVIDQMTKFSDRDQSAMVALKLEHFFQIADISKREFELFVMFSGGPECQPCEAVKELFAPAARKIRELRKAGHAKAKNTFFVVVEMSRKDISSSKIAQYGIEYAPYTVFVSKRMPLPPRGGQFPESAVFNLRHYAQIGMPTEDTMAEWASSVSGLPLSTVSRFSPKFFGISHAPSVYEIYFKLQPVLFVIVAVVTFCAIWFGWYRSILLYYSLLLVLFAASTSGMFYTIINGAPFALYRGGKWDLVQSGVRSMYAGEGWFASVSYIATGLLLLLAVEGPPTALVRRVQRMVRGAGGGKRGATGGNARGLPDWVVTISSGLLSLTALLGAVAIAEVIQALYVFKSSG